jgi:hypothetical protein
MPRPRGTTIGQPTPMWSSSVWRVENCSIFCCVVSVVMLQHPHETQPIGQGTRHKLQDGVAMVQGGETSRPGGAASHGNHSGQGAPARRRHGGHLRPGVLRRPAGQPGCPGGPGSGVRERAGPARGAHGDGDRLRSERAPHQVVAAFGGSVRPRGGRGAPGPAHALRRGVRGGGSCGPGKTASGGGSRGDEG